LIGRRIIDQTGEKVGSVSQVYLDDATGEPEWITVRAGLLGGKETFVPLAGCDLAGEDLRVRVTKERVKNAPTVDADEHLSPQQEGELYRFYGLGGPQRGAPQPESAEGPAAGPASPPTSRPITGMSGGVVTGAAGGKVGTGGKASTVGTERYAQGEPTVPPEDMRDEAMTRSEERIQVHTEEHVAGRVRLHKYVVTEDVTQTVPVSHEEARLVREPITEANRAQAVRGQQIRESEFEVILHEQRPIVETEVVPVERVRLVTERITGEQTVSGKIRREELRVEGDESALAHVREDLPQRESGRGRHGRP
jgi:stress response protein YsnF